jgi:hypothetical protein
MATYGSSVYDYIGGDVAAYINPEQCDIHTSRRTLPICEASGSEIIRTKDPNPSKLGG